MQIRSLLLAAALVCIAAPARADEAERAAKLFSEASSLMEKGRYEEACDKFAESQRLDPGLGTEYNLALCYEKVGRLASAFRLFREVQTLAHATGKQNREQAAHERAEILRPKVASLAITSASDAATIKVDGAAVPKDEWTFVPVDPGEHAVSATEDGKKPWSAKITVAAREGARTDVTVPPLEVIAPKVVTVTRETTNTRRTAGYVAGAIGLAGVVAATVTGILVLRDQGIADDECNPRCTSRGSDAVSRGKTLLPINAISFGVAALGLGVGSYLILTSSPKSSASADLVVRF